MRARVLYGTVAELRFKVTGSYGETIAMETRFRFFFLSCETNMNFKFVICSVKKLSSTVEEVMKAQRGSRGVCLLFL